MENNINKKSITDTEKKITDLKDEKIINSTKKKSSLKKYYIFMGFTFIFLFISIFAYNKYVLNADKIPVKKINNNHEILQSINKTKKITIYVPDNSIKKLIPIDTEISSNNFSDDIDTIFNLIKENSGYSIKNSKGEYIPYFNQNIHLLNSYLIGNQLYLNLSPNIINSIHFKKQELLIIYSLVNTFTSLDEVDKVKILINDKEVDKIKWYNLRTFYAQNLDI
jgi:hypothetical protein